MTTQVPQGSTHTIQVAWRTDGLGLPLAVEGVRLRVVRAVDDWPLLDTTDVTELSTADYERDVSIDPAQQLGTYRSQWSARTLTGQYLTSDVEDFEVVAPTTAWVTVADVAAMGYGDVSDQDVTVAQRQVELLSGWFYSDTGRLLGDVTRHEDPDLARWDRLRGNMVPNKKGMKTLRLLREAVASHAKTVALMRTVREDGNDQSTAIGLLAQSGVRSLYEDGVRWMFYSTEGSDPTGVVIARETRAWLIRLPGSKYGRVVRGKVRVTRDTVQEFGSADWRRPYDGYWPEGGADWAGYNDGWSGDGYWA